MMSGDHMGEHISIYVFCFNQSSKQNFREETYTEELHGVLSIMSTQSCGKCTANVNCT